MERRMVQSVNQRRGRESELPIEMHEERRSGRCSRRSDAKVRVRSACHWCGARDAGARQMFCKKERDDGPKNGKGAKSRKEGGGGCCSCAARLSRWCLGAKQEQMVSWVRDEARVATSKAEAGVHDADLHASLSATRSTSCLA